MKDMADALCFDGIGSPATEFKVYGKALAQLGDEDERILCLSADLTTQTEADIFRDRHPERFLSMGMAEQNMVGVASGLARAGEIPFAHSFACFLSRKCFDQIVNAVAYPRLPVKLVGVMPGISSPGGISHQAIDDLAMFRAIPGMTVIDLGESEEVSQAPKLAAEVEGPVYLRLRRGILPKLFRADRFSLEVGQSYRLRSGTDVGIITSGLMTERVLQATSLLERQGISVAVLHVPSIKPLDVEGILFVASSVKLLLTVDNHNIIGGLGSAVAEVLAEHRLAVPFVRLGLRDIYAKAGTNAYLYRLFGFDPDQIADRVLAALGHEVAARDVVATEAQGAQGWGDDWNKG
ncbi:MAG: transketolase family protein [Alicyclobacillus sp.]|nr:transketolase family protein [Alicyclobacillus sp.]